MFMHSIEAFVRVLCIIISVENEERIHVCFIFLSFSRRLSIFFIISGFGVRALTRASA